VGSICHCSRPLRLAAVYGENARSPFFLPISAQKKATRSRSGADPSQIGSGGRDLWARPACAITAVSDEERLTKADPSICVSSPPAAGIPNLRRRRITPGELGQILTAGGHYIGQSRNAPKAPRESE
jgi:hypothetical protein